jgi:hypothetical protein
VTLVDLGPGAPDIFYPSYFEGRWASSSTTVAVEAPCGALLFGGERNLEAARLEVGTAVEYGTLFFRDGRPKAAGAIVADRPFNIRASVPLGPGAADAHLEAQARRSDHGHHGRRRQAHPQVAPPWAAAVLGRPL